MLDEHGVDYEVREYTKDALSAAEIRAVLKALGLSATDVLRKRDPAYAELGLTGDESEADLIGHMAAHPTLLQRPIGVRGSKAVIGRPVENLLDV